MNQLLQLWRRLRFYPLLGRFDRELAAEMDFYLELKAQENLRARVTPAAARAAAGRLYARGAACLHARYCLDLARSDLLKGDK